MRILQVVHGFPPREWAGMELITYYLSQALRARGHEVTVFTRTGEDGAEFSVREDLMDGLRVVRVVNHLIRADTFRLGYDNPFFDDIFAQLLAQVRPDVVNFQHLATLSVSLLPLTAALGYPTILNLGDFFFPCHIAHLIDTQGRLCAGPRRGEQCISCLQGIAPAEELRRRFRRMEEVLQAPDLVTTLSAFLAQKIQQYYPFLGQRLRPVPLGVHQIPPVSREPSRGAPLRVLYVGIFLPHKGAHVLIEALKGLPADTIEVSLYGANPLPFWQSYFDRLQEEAKHLPVRFCGVYTHDQLGPILARHDVLVLPVIWEETFSMVVREALAAGLPVVAARIGALPDVIQDGVNGLLFEPENAADLHRCLGRLLNEPGLFERLRSVPTQVKTMEEYAHDMEAVYAEVCEPSYRVRALQQRLTTQHQEATTLQQENQQLEAEIQELRVQHTAVCEERNRLSEERIFAEEERKRALATMQELQNLLGNREEQLREKTARLEAIYASTTWKLYRGYAALRRFLVQRPLDSSVRGLTRAEQETVQILQNADSWIAPTEIGTRIPPYRRTFVGPEFINEHHRFFACCPVKEEILIDMGIPGWLRREDALKLYEMAYFTRGPILELGTYQGLSTAILTQAAKDTGKGKLITSVDLDPRGIAEAERHLKQRGLDTYVRLVCAEATQFCHELINNQQTFGFVFIDHSHAYRDVGEICQLLPALLPAGGFCLFHDFNDVRNNDVSNLDYGVSRAVYDALSMEVFDFYGIYGCTALYRKKM